MAIKIVIGGDNNYLTSVVALAKRVYNPDDVSSLDRYKSLFKACPEAFFFAVDTLTQQVAGYIIALPLTEDFFERTLLDDYTEADLMPEHIKSFKVGNNHIAFFSIVGDPSHPQRITVFRNLVEAFKVQMRTYAKERKYVTQASALTWSATGIKLCIGMKMQSLGSNEMGTVYHNPKFHELFVDTDTKNQIIKNFIHNRRGN